MCLFKAPTLDQPVSTPAFTPPPVPFAPPEPVEIGATGDKLMKRKGRNSLRIDLAGGGAGNTSLKGRTGLNI